MIGFEERLTTRRIGRLTRLRGVTREQFGRRCGKRLNTNEEQKCEKLLTHGLHLSEPMLVSAS
jgi:hypothetical protein